MNLGEIVRVSGGDNLVKAFMGERAVSGVAKVEQLVEAGETIEQATDTVVAPPDVDPYEAEVREIEQAFPSWANYIVSNG